MRVTSVEIHPEGSTDVCVLSYRDPTRQNPYNVRAIMGLDADDIVARYYGVSESSGAKFYNLTLEKRDIVARIELNPNFATDESFSDLRDRLMRMIASSRTAILQIQFKDGTTVKAAVSGKMKKLETTLFEGNPEVQLTIECDDPILRDPVAVDVDVAALNPALTDIQDEESTAWHGLNFVMEFVNTVPSFVIGNTGDMSWSFEVVPVGGFISGDKLHLSSDPNNKYLYRVRGAVTTHLADVILPGSIWPVMFPGHNELICENPTDMEWFEILYYRTYWGV